VLKRILSLYLAGYVLVLTLVLVLGLLAITSMNRLHRATTDLYAHPFTVNNAALEAQSNILWIRDNALDMVASHDPQEIEKLLQEAAGRDKQVRERIGVVETNFLGDRERVSEIQHLLDEWRQLREREAALVKQGNRKMADAIAAGQGASLFKRLSADMDYVIDHTRQRAANFVAEANEESSVNIVRTRWLLAGLIALISVIGWIVARSTISVIRREERAAQALRQYSNQLEEANKELESFSYSIAHDLRVPLRGIDGFTRILLDEYQGQLDAEGQRLLNVVRASTRRMSQLIDDILDFTRLGRKEPGMEEVDMEASVRTAMHELAPALAGRKIDIDIARLPPASGDAAMLHQVWNRLLGNAIKFTRPKPEATIQIGGRIEGKEAVFQVADNGVGFDMQYAAKLFGVFQRLHSLEEFEGTGIGLAIVKRIIAKHGGRVWAEGKVNEGATVYFALPLKEKDHG